MKHTLNGLHHVSALTADAAQNHDFYTRVLGLRLVKKTVNQDDPSMYHLFYGDGEGRPGSEMTFFEFPRAAREHRGANSITRTTFRVAGEAALEYWQERLEAEDIPRQLAPRDGRLHLDFEDRDGTVLSLIDDGGMSPRAAANPCADVPQTFQIQGLGYSGLTVSRLEPTEKLLTAGLGLHEVRRYEAGEHTTHVFGMGEGGVHAELHLTVNPDLPRRCSGAGAVHHVALRVPTESDLEAWAERLTHHGAPHSGVIDRYYFRSLYIRDPNGLVIELATDEPGFTADEAPESLGERLALPPSLEPRRAAIERRLTPLHIAPLHIEGVHA